MPMDPEERIVCDFQAEVCNHVHREADARAGTDDVARASSLLYQRIGQGYRSARTLREFARHDWSVDGVIILRTLYDATMQLLWLLADSDERANRAKLYLDFIEIEKHKILHRVDSSGTDMGAAMRKSPRRPEGDKQRQKKLREVGETYLTNRGRRRFDEQGESYLTEPTASYRANWYPFSNLADLVVELGYGSEYPTFQKDASASVHASSWSLKYGTAIKPEFVLTWAMTLALRAAGAIVETYDIPLDEHQAEVIDDAKRNMYDKPEPPPEAASRASEVTQ